MSWAWIYRRRAVGAWAWAWLPAICWLLVLGSLAVEIGIRSDVVWDLAAGPLGIHAAEPDAAALHEDLHRFYYAGQQTLMHPGWSDDERAHLHDVRAILDGIRWIGLLAAAVILVLSLWRHERMAWMRRGGLMVTGVLLALGILATQWSVFSRVLHPLVFPQGNWDFLPGRDVIIELYTQEMLAIYGASILGLVVAGAGALWLIGRLGTGRGPGISWTWRRRQLLLPVLAVLVAPALWWAGSHMHADGDPGYRTYYLLAGLLPVVCIWMLAAQDKAWATLVVLLVVLLWNVQITALRQQVRAAAATCAQQGEDLRAAIESYRRQHGGLPPPDLDALVPRYLEALPPIDGGAGPWFYRRHGRHYAVGFPGPLDFGHGYTSWRGSWNVLPWLGIY